MKEISNIIRDLRSGALSIRDLPGLLAILCRQIAWASIALVIAFLIGYLFALISA